jgi:lipopolysaccharide transport system permease protein
VGQTTGIITTVMMFLSSVFYPVSTLPETYRLLLHINPLTFIIEQTRDIIIWGRLPNWQGLGIYLIISLIVAGLGFVWFQKTRKGFADVL